MSDEENEGAARRAAPDAGSASAPQNSDHHRARQGSRLKAVLATGALVVVGWVAYEVAWPDQRRTDAVRVLPKSENVLAPVTQPPVDMRTVRSHLVIEPGMLAFGQLVAGREHQTLSMTMTAKEGPVDVVDVSLPFAQSSGLDVRAETCQGHKLAKDTSCVVTVVFSPTGAENLTNNMLVRGTTYDVGGPTGGATHELSTPVSVIGSAVLPPPDPPKPVAVDYSKLRQTGLQNAFLAARARATLGDQSGKVLWKSPGAPVDQDWSGMGFQRNESSFPVDLTRVVTMDKDIPAVMAVPIDTRDPSRAVAVVERDVYGGDGRLVVIERGSKLIGRVAAIADSSEEKVSIEWQRLMRPDGVMFSFEATTGDAMGRSGALAHIDNRWLERFGTTGLASLVEAGLTIGIGGNQTATTQNGTTVNGVGGTVTTGGTTTLAQNARSVASQQLRQDLQPLYEEFKREQLALPVIRTVPAGTRITVWPSTDLWLKAVPTGRAVDAPSVASTGSEAGKNPYDKLASSAGGDAPAKVDTSIGNRSASSVLRDRMTMTGSTAGSLGVNPNVAAYGRYGSNGYGAGTAGYGANGYGYGATGYGTTGYGATGYGAAGAAPGMAAGGVAAVAAPPWGVQ